jgi:putative zinc finger/helix-turn-helix YgiT family protein
MSDICVACGHPTLTEQVVPFEFRHGQKTVTIQDSQTVCRTCGTISYVGEQASRHELAVATKIRELDGLLSPDELRNIRLKYAFRQTDLEAMLSVGPKTWTRWERGKVPQSKAADTLIRVLAKNPDVARDLMEQAGIENPAASAIFARIDEDARGLATAKLRTDFLNRPADADAGGLATQAVEVVWAFRHGRGVEAA